MGTQVPVYAIFLVVVPTKEEVVLPPEKHTLNPTTLSRTLRHSKAGYFEFWGHLGCMMQSR